LSLSTRLCWLVVQAWRYLLAPVMGNNCRFHPSCSAYALEALARHGAARGGWLALARIMRCHPWHPGGYDPVAPAGKVPSGPSTG